MNEDMEWMKHVAAIKELQVLNCEGFVAALPGSKLESNGVLREFFREH